MTRSVPFFWALALAFTSIGPALAQAPNGKAIYDAKCVECHGKTGKGDGPAAAMLVPRPRDFTTGKYKIRTTESGTGPADEDVIQSIRQGLYGSAMPAWDRILSDQEISAVAAYVRSLAPRTLAPTPVVVNPPLPSSPESIPRRSRA
jgi:mono/diheme cytochrome c family protein